MWLDPHPANLLIRPRSDNPRIPQIVLLDHGLYINLPEKFRRDYCRLWYAIVTSNSEDIQKYCKEMNAESTYTLLTAMLTLRPWHDVVSNDFNR
jgi:aarF domain-containing kinase